MKYYWGVDWFVKVAGYGTSLSDEDYEKMRTQALEKYRESLAEKFSGETIYVYADGEERKYVNDEWLEKYGVSKANRLLVDDEKINDYYILASDYLNSSQYVRFKCVLCNDSSKRIIEIRYRNTHPYKGF